MLPHLIRPQSHGTTRASVPAPLPVPEYHPGRRSTPAVQAPSFDPSQHHDDTQSTPSLNKIRRNYQREAARSGGEATVKGDGAVTRENEMKEKKLHR